MTITKFLKNLNDLFVYKSIQENISRGVGNSKKYKNDCAFYPFCFVIFGASHLSSPFLSFVTSPRLFPFFLPLLTFFPLILFLSLLSYLFSLFVFFLLNYFPFSPKMVKMTRIKLGCRTLLFRN